MQISHCNDHQKTLLITKRRRNNKNNPPPKDGKKHACRKITLPLLTKYLTLWIVRGKVILGSVKVNTFFGSPVQLLQRPFLVTRGCCWAEVAKYSLWNSHLSFPKHSALRRGVSLALRYFSDLALLFFWTMASGRYTNMYATLREIYWTVKSTELNSAGVSN